MNRREDWACERVFAPVADMEQLLRARAAAALQPGDVHAAGRVRRARVSRCSTSCATRNVLTMLDLGGIPLGGRANARSHPLVIAGGPCVANPEPMARFIDLFVIGDGEEMPAAGVRARGLSRKRAGGDSREEALAALAAELPYVYVPRFYRAGHAPDGRAPADTSRDVPELIEPAVVEDLDAVPLPTAPVVPYVECVQDRIAIEIMRGCPVAVPLLPEHDDQAARCGSAAWRRSSRRRWSRTATRATTRSRCLSLSTSDYPHFDELLAAVAGDISAAGREHLRCPACG